MSDNGNIASPELRNDDVLLDVQHLTKLFAAETNFFGKATSYVHAVDDVSFQIKRGEAFGLVGESGCGKTTVGKMLVNLLRPTSGKIIFDGKDLTAMKDSERKIYCKDIQLIFQDPYSSLNPKMNVLQNITFGLTANQVPRDEACRRAYRYLDAVGMQKSFLNKYPNSLSGGQRQRVAVARALAMEPKIILADEPVSALDKSVQAQVLNLFHDLQKEFGISIIFISHDLSVVEYMSDHIAVLYLGEVIEYSTSEELYHNPRHPYTKELLRSIPQISGDARLSTANREPPIELPSPIRPPSGCRYHPRCPYRTENCSKHIPAPALVGRDHIVKCHRCAAQNQPIEPMEGSLI